MMGIRLKAVKKRLPFLPFGENGGGAVDSPIKPAIHYQYHPTMKRKDIPS
jgi:hypothetical protein